MNMVHEFRASTLAVTSILYHRCGHIVVTNWVVERKLTRAKKLYCLGVVSHHLFGPCHLD